MISLHSVAAENQGGGSAVQCIAILLYLFVQLQFRIPSESGGGRVDKKRFPDQSTCSVGENNQGNQVARADAAALSPSPNPHDWRPRAVSQQLFCNFPAPQICGPGVACCAAEEEYKEHDHWRREMRQRNYFCFSSLKR